MGLIGHPPMGSIGDRSGALAILTRHPTTTKLAAITNIANTFGHGYLQAIHRVYCFVFTPEGSSDMHASNTSILHPLATHR